MKESATDRESPIVVIRPGKDLRESSSTDALGAIIGGGGGS
jgi:hypothetical protein